MILTVNGHDLRLELADNSSAKALASLVGDDGLDLALEDYVGFEKVGPLPQRLPTHDEQITARAGDVVLYQGDKLSIFYKTNSWSYTRLGRITDAGALRQVLGQGAVNVTLRPS